MNVDSVVGKMYQALSNRPAVQKVGPETVKAILSEELNKRADRFNKDQPGVMAACMTAALRRAAAQAQ